MKLLKIKSLLDAELKNNIEGWEDIEFKTACGADLMSDVLAYVKDKSLLLSGLANHQVFRTAEMLDIRGIVFVRGKEPNDELIEFSEKIGIPVLVTDLPLYQACGILYSNGLGCKGDAKCEKFD